MGTGGLVVFRSAEKGARRGVYACIYFQCDGYYTSLGVRLAEFLKTCKLVNGLSGEPDDGKIICNGFGCLVAQFISHFKTGAGHLYMFPTDCKLEMEFVYIVECDDSRPPSLSVKSWMGAHPNPEDATSMSLDEFHAFSLQGGPASEDEAEGTAAEAKPALARSVGEE
ncbi:unnamed protein product [Symbiodinium natans]|uniref:Uncharacterized protein n=1 Tax=Symbiodinium natans TaxID=878477 RepID=A0A812UNH6_9DINO|nr:unnamed protein product [Symbiodinium natans]